MTDLASLVLAIDSTQVKTGTASLDGLTAAGARAEAATLGLGKGARTASTEAAALAASAQAAARAAVGQAAGFGAVTGAVHGNTIAMRESLVVGRELLNGNLTRLPGSLSILAQQFAISGKGASGFAQQILQSFGIIKTTMNAELANEAAAAQASAAAIGAAAARAQANVLAADTEVALAQAAIKTAATTEALAAAQAELAVAHEAVAAAAAEATTAEVALAEAAGTAAAASDAAGASAVTSLGTVGAILVPLGAAAALAFGAFKIFQDQVRDSGDINRYAESLRLTDEQIRKAGGSVKYLADRTREITGLTVTFGNVANATFQVLMERAGISAKGTSDAFTAAFRWIGDFGKFTIAVLLAGFASLVALVASLAVNLKNVATGNFDRLTNPLKDMKDQFFKTFGDVNAGFDKIDQRAKELRDQQLKTESDANKPPKPKKESDHGLAEALAELDAQIKGQLALAAAYQVSDAAAIKAEARQKAEEQAIHHKGDVELFYEKELALALATRAAEGGKIIADLTAETTARKLVNDAVSAGALDASQAGTALKDAAQRRALEAALSVAQEKGWVEQVKLLRAELDKLTDSQVASNFEAYRSQVLAATSSGNDEIEKLQLEASLIGATNKVRAVAIAQLQAEQFLRDHPGATAAEAQQYLDTQKAIAAQTVENTTAQTLYNNSLSYMADLMTLLDQRAQQTATSLTNAFGAVGTGIGQALTSLTAYAATQAKLDQEHAAAVKAGISDDAERALHAKASADAQIQAIGGVLDATKSLFGAHSAGYRAMDALEKAFAIAQLARTIASIAPKIAAGAATMFSQLGVFAFPAVAAMIAVMAGLGFAGGNSTQKAPTSADDLQKAAGTGTVLGDTTAKSQSIADSLTLMAKNSTKGLDYSSEMVSQLRAIASNIGNLAASLAQQLQLKGGFFDTAGKTGTNSSGGLLGLFASTKTTSLFDQGIQIDPATLGQIIQNGIAGATYQVIETVKHNSGFLGIGASTKTSYSTTTGALDGDISRQIQLIVGQLYTSVVSAAKVLGLDVGAALKQFQVEIGQISFKDLTGQQITDELNAIFSKIGDQMAGFAVAGLAQFQKAGEGLFETLMRLAKDYLTIDAALKSIGMTFGSVGASSIAARESLIDLAGGLDAFVSQVNFFYDHFLTDAQKVAMEQAQVNASFSALGVAVPASIADFTKLVQGINLSTDAGQQMFEALMQIAPAFYDVATAADQLAQKQQALQVQLLQAQGKTTEATALQRQIDLAALDPSLRALQQSIYDAQDAAAAAAKALDLQNKAQQLQITLLQAQGKATAALALQRKAELAALDPSLRGLQQQVYAAQDLATAKDNLVQAYKRESAALQQTADKFRKFATDLKAFRDSLFTTADSGSQSYNAALIQLMKQAGLASGGNEDALGGGLQSSAQTFLDVATQNARSVEDVQRARALVARYLDQAIGSANATASVAQQQLDQMTAQVSKLADINDSVLSVADAIKALTALMFPPSAPVVTPTPPSPRFPLPAHGYIPVLPPDAPGRALNQKILDRLDDIHAATAQTAVSSNKTARVLYNADRGGALALVTDADSPIATVAG